MPQCCLLTTMANALPQPNHDRMPVIVRREDWEEWFSPGELGDQGFQRITAPYRAEETSALAISPLAKGTNSLSSGSWSKNSNAQKLTA
jgi:putative SOS response-associated peptidase YedK